MSGIKVEPAERARLRTYILKALETNYKSLNEQSRGLKVTGFDNEGVLAALEWEESRRLPTTTILEILNEAVEKGSVRFLPTKGRRKDVWVWVPVEERLNGSPKKDESAPVVTVKSTLQTQLGPSYKAPFPPISGDMRNKAANVLLVVARTHEQNNELFTATEARQLIQHQYRREEGFKDWKIEEAHGILREVLEATGCRVRFLNPKDMRNPEGVVPDEYLPYLFTFETAGKIERNEIPLPPLPVEVSEVPVNEIVPIVVDAFSFGLLTEMNSNKMTLKLGGIEIPIVYNQNNNTVTLEVGDAELSATSGLGQIKNFSMSQVILSLNLKK